MYWSVDGRLIRRGELFLSLDFLEVYDAELTALNIGKVCRPFKITFRYVEFPMVVRYLSQCLIGSFTRALNRLIGRMGDGGWAGMMG